MSDPLGRYLAQQQGASDPLGVYLAQQQQGVQLGTAQGRQMFDAQSRAGSIEKLRELLKRTDLDPDHRRRIETEIHAFENEDHGRAGGGYGMLADFGRGEVAGFAQAAPQAADLALTIPDLAVRGINKVTGGTSNVARDMRGGLQENVQGIQEALDPRGLAGTAGAVAGGMLPSMLPYGAAAGVAGKVISKALPAASKIGQALAGAEVGGMGTKIAANVISGAPINALQAVSMDDATMGDRAKQFAIGTLADAGFPLATHPLHVDPKVDLATRLQRPGEAGAKPETPIDVSPAIGAAKERLQVLGFLDSNKEIKKGVYDAIKEQWKIDHPDVPWKNTAGSVRRTLAIEYAKAHMDELIAKTEPEVAPVDQPVDPQPEPIARTDPSTPKAIIEQADTPVRVVSQPPAVMTPLDPNTARKLFATPLDRLTPEQLNALENWVDDRVISLPSGENDVYRARQQQIMEHRAQKEGIKEPVADTNADKVVSSFKQATELVNDGVVAIHRGPTDSHVGEGVGRTTGDVYSVAGNGKVLAKTQSRVNGHDIEVPDHFFVTNVADPTSPPSDLMIQRATQIINEMVVHPQEEDVSKGIPSVFGTVVQAPTWATATREFSAKIANSPWMATFTDTTHQLFEELGTMLGINTLKYGKPRYAGVRLHDNVAGLNSMGMGGPNAITLNPLVFHKLPEMTLAESHLATAIHEYAHQQTRSEGAPLRVVMDHLYNKLKQSNNYAKINDRFNQLWETLSNDAEFKQHRAEFSEAWGHDVANYKSSHSGYDAGQATRGVVDSGAGGTETWSSSPRAVRESEGEGSARRENPAIVGRFGTVRKDQSYIRAGMKGGATGMVAGYLATDDDDPQRMAKIAMYAALGAGGALVTKELWHRLRPQEGLYKVTIPGTEGFNKVVYSTDELPGRKRPTTEWLRGFYRGVVHGNFGLERTLGQHAVGGEKLSDLPAQTNSAKKANIYGRWVSMTESWLTHQPVIVGDNGNPIYLLDDAGNPVKAANRILSETARGEKANLDVLLAARTSIEQAGLRPQNQLPMGMQEAEVYVRNAPEYLHRAADELRQYHKALLRALLSVGRISQAGFDKMASEDWYAPLMRVLRSTDEQAVGEGSRDIVRAVKGIHERGGGGRGPVLSPYEATVEMTARVMRSVEMTDIVGTMWKNSRAHPDGLGDTWMRRGDNRTNPGAEKIKGKITQLAQDMKITESDAAGMIAYFDDSITTYDSAAEGKRYLVSGYDDGKLVTYHVSPEVFDSVRHLQTVERDAYWHWLGLPSRLASKGVVHNPYFTGIQAFIDTFQATLTSNYGFRPFWDSIRGAKHIYSMSPEYRALLDVGGPSTIQSLRYSGELGAAVRATGTAGTSVPRTALNQLRELHPFEAYKTLMTPISEAARVGEYLRALDHGASVLEGAYAAWNVMGNVRMQGSLPGMKIFNSLTMFTRPSISAIDEFVFKSGFWHPRRGGAFDPKMAMSFLGKGFAMITLPTVYHWWANKDDKEINQLRRTEGGEKYWFSRVPGTEEIIKVRKPHVIGHLFGTVVEDLLDKHFADDPQGTSNWVSGLAQDVGFNILPQVGVIPVGLWANTMPGTGAKIIPDYDKEHLEPQMWGRDNASLPARIVADKIGVPLQKGIKTVFGEVPASLQTMLSPAALDFVVRSIGGMWGEDGLKAVTYANEWSKEKLPPPSEEAPVIGRMFSSYPKANVGPIRMFYDVASKVDRVAGTIAKYSHEDPAKLAGYMMDNREYMMVAPAYKEARAQITEYWRAINDVKAMPEDVVSAARKRDMEKMYLRLIITRASMANTLARSMLNSK